MDCAFPGAGWVMRGSMRHYQCGDTSSQSAKVPNGKTDALGSQALSQLHPFDDALIRLLARGFGRHVGGDDLSLGRKRHLWFCVQSRDRLAINPDNR
jgi:hypothetical protein